MVHFPRSEKWGLTSQPESKARNDVGNDIRDRVLISLPETSRGTEVHSGNEQLSSKTDTLLARTAERTSAIPIIKLSEPIESADRFLCVLAIVLQSV
jgi:hypothetical protein